MASFKVVPPGLKAIQPYLKIAEEHEKRDPSITYWCKQNFVYVFWRKPPAKKIPFAIFLIQKLSGF